MSLRSLRLSPSLSLSHRKANKTQEMLEAQWNNLLVALTHPWQQKKLNKQTACCLHVDMLWYVGIITTQDKDSTRKNSSGLLHAMIKVKIQKIALLAVVGWHHQCPNSLFHNSSRIHKCQQWQGMTRVPPPKVPKWLRLKLWQALPAKTVGLGCLGGGQPIQENVSTG